MARSGGYVTFAYKLSTIRVLFGWNNISRISNSRRNFGAHARARISIRLTERNDFLSGGLRATNLW